MVHQSTSVDGDAHLFPQAREQMDMLRFITCGSVDDGKSTLISRLLWDSRLLFVDEVAALEADSKHVGSQGDGIDFALLLDGLQAKREQGITIDVAYHFFSTKKRKFIVADSPGHEQYTCNMLPGASTADVAIIVVDARKGILTQTRRHSYLVSMVGIRKVLFAVNKMDLVDYCAKRFNSVCEEFQAFAAPLGFEQITMIPISALKGDNIIERSAETSWYRGATLLAYLEMIDAGADVAYKPFRMPVQWVNRPNLDFHGFSGTIASGVIRPNDEIVVPSSGRISRVMSIVTMAGELREAVAGQAVTLTLTDEIDISRGDLLSSPEARPAHADQFEAKLAWLHEDPMLPGRDYLIKIGAVITNARVSELKYRINVNMLEHQAAKTLRLNEVGVCNISVNKLISFDPYEENHSTGSFILIDRNSNATVGAGMIDFALRRAGNICRQYLDINKSSRSEMKGQKPRLLWFTGLSGSGKSTIANLVEKKLHFLGKHTYILDGDNVRHGLNKDLGFTNADRVENIRRVAETAKLFVDAGLIVLVSFISPFRSERQMAREMMEDGEFVEIFVDTPLNICEKRDPKGLYKKAQAGELKNFTGIDSIYEVPEKPEIIVDAERSSAEELAEIVVREILTADDLCGGRGRIQCRREVLFGKHAA